MKIKKRNSGITLIALVITVIILLILAGVAVSIGLNGGDLFSKANEAKTGWNRRVNEENTISNNYLGYLDKYTDAVVDTVTLERLKLYFENNKLDNNLVEKQNEDGSYSLKIKEPLEMTDSLIAIGEGLDSIERLIVRYNNDIYVVETNESVVDVKNISSYMVQNEDLESYVVGKSEEDLGYYSFQKNTWMCFDENLTYEEWSDEYCVFKYNNKTYWASRDQNYIITGLISEDMVLLIKYFMMENSWTYTLDSGTVTSATFYNNEIIDDASSTIKFNKGHLENSVTYILIEYNNAFYVVDHRNNVSLPEFSLISNAPTNDSLRLKWKDENVDIIPYYNPIMEREGWESPLDIKDCITSVGNINFQRLPSYVETKEGTFVAIQDTFGPVTVKLTVGGKEIKWEGTIYRGTVTY